jgi:hypothetical protein
LSAGFSGSGAILTEISIFKSCPARLYLSY